MRELIRTGYVVRVKLNKTTKMRTAHILLQDGTTVCKVENGIKTRRGRKSYEVTALLPSNVAMCKNCDLLWRQLTKPNTWEQPTQQ